MAPTVASPPVVRINSCFRSDRLARLLLCLVFIGFCPAARAQQLSDARKLCEQLSEVTIDPAQVYVLRNAQITRDRVKIYFNHGFIGFFAKVNGEISGAVFSGQGEILMIPPNPVEKRNLAQFTGAPILEEQFVSLFMRFTDRTAQELLAVARRSDPDDPEQPTGLVEQWSSAVSKMNPDYSLRILQDFLGDRALPYFHARIQKTNGEAFELGVDERAPEAVSVGAARRSRGSLYADIWCLFPSRASETRLASLLMGPVQARSYKIVTRINPDNSLEGHAELELESRSAADRVLVFELSRWLKLSEVKDEGGQSLVFFQNPSLEDSEVAARGNDWIVVVQPSAHPVGEKFRLQFSYQGNVITDVGNGVLYVGARGIWYPNRSLSTRATYDLTFHYPERLTLVATGKRLSETASEGMKHSRWVSDGLFPVAGFNLGAYRSSFRKARNITIEVYATPEAEAALEKRYAAAQPRQAVVTTPRGGGGMSPVTIISRSVPPLAPAALLDRVAESAERAVQRFEPLLGPFPYPRLAISQIPGVFGQGWPELVYLPTLSFLPESQRSDLGVSGKYEELLNEMVIPHEIAHQWWGNQLGWKTYHDQWLSEGFASYTAALYLKYEKDGERKFREILRGHKRDLLSKTKEGKTVESGGPIWLGQRLSNSLNPEGYDSIVYKKACWVIHMLHMMMTDPATGSDDKFFKMLRDFSAAYRGQNASTEDFIRHAEKYMTRASDLEHNRRLEWFFEEWVYGTGIPTYKIETNIRRVATNKFVVQGSIEQSGVLADFEMPVPVVATLGRDRNVTLGHVAVGESGGKFRFTTRTKPTRVAIDEDNLLAVVH
jgi:hypothetical protein